MKLLALASALLSLITLPALAASFKDEALKVEVEAPADFNKSTMEVQLPEALGSVKGAFDHKNSERSGGQFILHHMPIPAEADYNGFKSSLPERVNEFLNGKAKVVRQEDVELGKFKGFLFEFEAPGDGKLPSPDGTIAHHVRWYLLRDGEDNLIGLVYHSREEAWKELEPKFAASLKTVKRIE